MSKEKLRSLILSCLCLVLATFSYGEGKFALGSTDGVNVYVDLFQKAGGKLNRVFELSYPSPRIFGSIGAMKKEFNTIRFFDFDEATPFGILFPREGLAGDAIDIMLRIFAGAEELNPSGPPKRVPFQDRTIRFGLRTIPESDLIGNSREDLHKVDDSVLE